MDTGRQMVLSGVGAGFFPWMQVASFVASGQATVIEVADLPPVDRVSALIRRAGAAPLSPAAEALVQAIRERAAALDLVAETDPGRR
jgi:DNA-binding transcriptional LysR family regulator